MATAAAASQFTGVDFLNLDTLLSEEERTLLARLSIFAGGFTLEAAEEICSGGAVPRGDGSVSRRALSPPNVALEPPRCRRALWVAPAARMVPPPSSIPYGPRTFAGALCGHQSCDS